MTRKLGLALTLAAFTLAAGTVVLAPRALAQGQQAPTANQSTSPTSFSDNEAVAEQSKKKRRKKSSVGAPPRGSKAGSNSGE